LPSFQRQRLWLIAAVLIPLIPMRGMFSSERVFCFRDMGQEFWPMSQWFKMAAVTGEYPLWDPFLGFGQSAIADPVRGLLFPPVVLIRLLFPEALGLNVAVGLAIPVAALGAYLLLQRTAGAPAAATGAVAFAMAGPVLSSGNMLNLIWAVALMPWVLWSVLRVNDRWSGPAFAGAAFVVALQLLAGEPATNAATLALTFGLVLTLEPGGIRDLSLRALRTAGAMLAGVAVAAVQYLPLLYAVVQSERGGRIANLSFWSVHPLRLVECFAILPFGDPLMPPASQPWMAYLNSGREPFLLSLYLGATVGILALLGCTTGPRRRVIVWTLAAIVALVCAFGDHLPIYPSMVSLFPILRIFRYPEKYFVVVALCTSVLSAEGVDSMLRGHTNALRNVAIAGGMLATGLLGISFVVRDEPRQALLWSSLVCAVIGAAIVGIGTMRRRPKFAAWAPILLFGLTCAELATAGFGLNPQAHTATLIKPLWVVSATSRDDRVYVGGRAMCTGSGNSLAEDVIAPQGPFPKSIPTSNLPAIVSAKSAQFPSRWGVREAISVDNQILFPREYKAAVRAFCERSPIERSRFLERTGVRVQLLNAPPEGYFDTRTPVELLAPVVAYSSAKDFTRCAVVPSARIEPDAGIATAALFREDFNPENEVLVDRQLPSAGLRSEPTPASARIVHETSNTVTLEADSPVDGTLVLYDSFDPDWRVEVDGSPTEMARANGLFRGVGLAAGHHTIRFSYVPRSLIAGAGVSGIASALLVLTALLGWRRRRIDDVQVQTGSTT